MSEPEKPILFSTTVGPPLNELSYGEGPIGKFTEEVTPKTYKSPDGAQIILFGVSLPFPPK